MSYFSNYLLKQNYSNTTSTAATCAGSSRTGSQCMIASQNSGRKTSKPSTKKSSKASKASKLRVTKTVPATCIQKSSLSKPWTAPVAQGRQSRLPSATPSTASTSTAYTQKRPNHATNNTVKFLSSSTSDELVNAFTLKKKKPSYSYKSSVPQLSSATTAAVKAMSVKMSPFKSAVNFKADRMDIIKKSNKEKVNCVQKSASMSHTGSSHPRPQSAIKVKPVVVQEGPIELSDENPNLNKIFAEAKPLELDLELEHKRQLDLLKSSPSSPFLPQAANPENETRQKAETVSTASIHSRLYQNRLQLPLFPSSMFPTLFPVQQSNSDMWGTVRQSGSCIGRSSIPSLTSLPQSNDEIDREVPDENERDEIKLHEQISLDENRVPVKEDVSVIQILKNTILSNFGFFNSCRDSNNNIVVDNINETDSACTLAEEMLSAACAENILVDIDELIRISHDHVSRDRFNAFSNETTEEIPAPVTPFTFAVAESSRSTTPLSTGSNQECVPFPKEIEKQLHSPAKGKNILPFTCQVQPQRQNLLADVREEDENENFDGKLSSTRLKIKVSDLGISPPPSLPLVGENELEKNNKEEREEYVYHDVDSRLTSTATSFASICNECDDGDEEQEESSPISVQRVNFSREIGKSEKQTKLERLVMAINSGVDIMPENKPVLKGIMKAGTEKSTTSQSVLTEDAYLNKSDKAKTPTSVTSDSEIRRRAIKEKISFPVTYSHVGADYGFPSKISVSQVFKKLEELTSMDSCETFPAKLSTICEETGEDQDISSELDLKTPDNDEEEEFIGIIDSVCEYINSGLNYASSLIGGESDLEPREDVMLYNGYKIRVRGRRLLLESLHVNCDFTVDNNGTFNRTQSTPSYVALRPHTFSREQLEDSCEGRRIRIIIRVTDPIQTKKGDEIQQQCQNVKKSLGDTSAEGDGMNRDDDHKKEGVKEPKISSRRLNQLEHAVRKENGKWILSLGKSESGRDSHPNFVEIGCPLGVHPETIVYGMINGLLLIEAP